jgi:hypothetical protein
MHSPSWEKLATGMRIMEKRQDPREDSNWAGDRRGEIGSIFNLVFTLLFLPY